MSTIHSLETNMPPVSTEIETLDHRDGTNTSQDEAQSSFSRTSRTEIVHALFGESVGTCWGDFSCNYFRQRGRLYVCQQSVCFFSNLFGFERRICVKYEHVQSICLYRTTSIFIGATNTEEDYIFKSFQDRMVVLELLNQLHPNATPCSSLSRRTSSRDADSNRTSELVYESRDEHAQDSKLDESPDRPSGEGSSDEEEPSETEVDGQSDNTPSRRSSLDGSGTTAPPDVKKEWEESKIDVPDSYRDVAVTDVILPCSLDEFFGLFLADDAPHSITDYQRDHIGDTEVEATVWQAEDSNGGTETATTAATHWLSRSITFRHKLPNGLGVGPSSTITTRKQRLRRFDDFGLCLKTTTHVEGVPVSDAFYVDDKWILEARGETSVSLSVRHETRFIKRTMFKRMIMSNTAKQLQLWYEGYTEMLRSSVHAKGDVEKEKPAEDNLTVERTETTATPSNLGMLILVGAVVLLLHSIILHWRLSAMEQDVQLLRTDFARILK